MSRPTLKERLERDTHREHPTNCLIWDGPLNSAGYPSITLRRIYEQVKGQPLPDGYQVDHICRNRRCVEGSHLRAVTAASNTFAAWNAKTGSMSWRHLRMARLLHDQVGAKLRDL